MGDDTTVDKEQLETLATEAEILYAAGEILDALGETADGLDLDAEGTPVEDIETAEQTCAKISMAMTATLAKYNHVPDFDTLGADSSSDEDDGRSMFH
jgi:hypothetical protein